MLMTQAETSDVPRHETADELFNNCISLASFWSVRHVVTSAWLQHGPFAFWLVEAIRPSTLVELGTHNGFSFLAFCQAVERLGISTACYAVDTWTGDEHADFYGEDVYRRLTALQAEHYAGFSTLMRCRFDEALPYFPDASIDLLHIDGRHTYDDVKEEFDTWLPKMSSRGIILFHDTNVRERQFGVWKLWDEVRKSYPNFEFTHGHGLGVLAVGPDIPPPVRGLFTASPQQVDSLRAAYAHLGQAVVRQYDVQDLRQYLGKMAGEHAQAMSQQVDSLSQQAEALRIAHEARANAERRVVELETVLAGELPSDGGSNAAGRVPQTLAQAQGQLHEAKRRIAELVQLQQETVRRARQEQTRALAGLRRRDVEIDLPRELQPLRRLFRGKFAATRQMVRDYKDIATSPLFDGDWYGDHYTDIGRDGPDPVLHYLLYGDAEGRDPSPHFTTAAYLRANPDVAASGQNALLHYLRYGAAEDRRLQPAE